MTFECFSTPPPKFAATLARALLPAYLLLSLYVQPLWAYEVSDVKRGGSIRGTVRWNGPIPGERPVHRIEKNTDFCGKTFMDDALTVDPDTQGMQNVGVFLEDIQRGRAPQERYVGIIEGCRFKPRIILSVSKKYIGFRHNDLILHNIHAFRYDNQATIFNIGLPVHRWQQVIGQVVRRTGYFKLQCDIHAHMNGLIVTLEHDYFAVTGRDGRFEIKDIPPGRYRVAAIQAGYEVHKWEEDEAGSRPVYEAPHRVGQEIEVKEAMETTVNFEFGGKP